MYYFPVSSRNVHDDMMMSSHSAFGPGYLFHSFDTTREMTNYSERLYHDHTTSWSHRDQELEVEAWPTSIHSPFIGWFLPPSSCQKKLLVSMAKVDAILCSMSFATRHILATTNPEINNVEKGGGGEEVSGRSHLPRLFAGDTHWLGWIFPRLECRPIPR